MTFYSGDEIYPDEVTSVLDHPGWREPQPVDQDHDYDDNELLDAYESMDEPDEMIPMSEIFGPEDGGQR